MARAFLAAGELLENHKTMLPADRYKELKKRLDAQVRQHSQMALGWAKEQEEQATGLLTALHERYAALDKLCRDLTRRSGEAISQQELSEIRKALHQARREAKTLEDQEGEITRLRDEVSKIREEPIAYVDDLIDRYPRLFPGFNPLQEWGLEVTGWREGHGIGFDPTRVDHTFLPSDSPPHGSRRR